MKLLFLLPLLSMAFACNNNQSGAVLSFADSIAVRHAVDSTIKETQKNALFDTVGLSNAPIKVVKAKLVEREYSSYKDIFLVYKNVSAKSVSGIKFRWYGETVFSEPADMGNGLAEGFGGGFTEDRLLPGETDSGTWNILSRNGKTVVLAWPYEVVFSDGSKWKLN